LTLLRMTGIRVGFGAPPQRVQALRGVDLEIGAAEVLALVGESGSGKSTLARVAMRLLAPDEGRVIYGGVDVTRLAGRRLRALRRHAQMVFQDPLSSLDAWMTVSQAVQEPLAIHAIGSRAERRARAEDMLRKVGMSAEHDAKYPAALSGGQLQRVAIARALVLEPALLICDEPVSALDLSVQAQVLNLLMDLQEERRLGLMFITHDLSVVSEIADRVAVMYLGRIVEQGTRRQVLGAPRHPYTVALLSSATGGWKPPTAEILLEGDPPSPVDPPSGCGFRERCWKASDLCAKVEPVLAEGDGQRSAVACHHPE
jgi:oligopeptide/dipeptide ABC transporter ATP-binding protein